MPEDAGQMGRARRAKRSVHRSGIFRYLWILVPAHFFRPPTAELKKVTHFPAVLAGFCVTMLACLRAHRALRNGTTQYCHSLTLAATETNESGRPPKAAGPLAPAARV